MTAQLSRHLMSFIHNSISAYNIYDTSQIASFDKYLEIDCNCDTNDIEVPCFAARTISDYTELKNKRFSFIIPLVDNENYVTVSTANAFFSCSNTCSLNTVLLKDKKYKIGRGIIIDEKDNILMLSTATIKRESLDTTNPIILVSDVYISVSVLENVRNTVEKAILQKIVPYLIHKSLQVHITDKMPFEKKVKNVFSNDNFKKDCYEAIKEAYK